MERLETLLSSMGPVRAAFLATIFAWLVTALGASVVLLVRPGFYLCLRVLIALKISHANVDDSIQEIFKAQCLIPI